MAEINLFEGDESLPVPAQTVFAVLKMIINSRNGNEFYESLSAEDVVMLSPKLINRAKTFIDEKNVAPRAELRYNVLKCNAVTDPHQR